MSVDTEAEYVKPLDEIVNLDGYLKNYGAILGRKAVDALQPLHVPSRDTLPDFSEILRSPFPCQQHAIAAAMKMMDAVGSGFLCGEMGTGKTLMGMVSVHIHAGRSRRQGGSGGRYRSLVVCPDHLIGKWCREIENTIPGAIVTRFGPQTAEEVAITPVKRGKGKKKPEAGTRLVLRDTVALLDMKNGRNWQKPEGAEWYVIGRNQAKWLSDWTGLADPRKGCGGQDVVHALSSTEKIVGVKSVLDQHDRPTYDREGRPILEKIKARVYRCPKCGTIAKDKKGNILGTKDLIGGRKDTSQKTCLGLYLQQLPSIDKAHGSGLDRICPVPEGVRAKLSKSKSSEVDYKGKKWVVAECKEPLYHYTPRPYRWSSARIIQKKCRKMFTYLIIDEVHEHKSDESARSMAVGKLMAAARHTLALTGTIIGGYASHLFPLMMRLTPRSLREEGFEWGDSFDFAKVYGKIEITRTIKEDDGGGSGSRGNSRSMRKAKSGPQKDEPHVKPGIVPTMFANHMIGSTIFITLDEMADELPDLFEYVGGAMLPEPQLEEFDDDAEFTSEEKHADAMDRYERMAAGWVQCAIDMDPDQAAEYKRIDGIMQYVNSQLLATGRMNLLGAYLATMTDYPDRPFGWDHDPEVKKSHALALKEAEEAETHGIAAEKPTLSHTVGYWDKPRNRHIDNYIGVVTPRSLDTNRVYPKEQALIDICVKQKEKGTQTWVYVNMTQKRDIQPRLKALLEREGLKVGILKAGDVTPIEREAWIESHGKEFDVMLSHPGLVSTGLDLFSTEEGGHNYSAIVFYQTGYNLFTMAQAARRAWRIGQPRDCQVYYLYYKHTMQHQGVALMSQKKAALDALNGDFSADGLAAMAGEDNNQMSLAKSLSEKISDGDMQRSWTKIKSNPNKKRPIARPGDIIKVIANPTRRVPWAMPRACDLVEMTTGQRAAFLKIAGSPDLNWNQVSIGCSDITLKRLSDMGLVDLTGIGTVRCKLSGGPLEAMLAWLALYPEWTGLYMPLGIVSASHPMKGEHYVSVVMKGDEPIGVQLTPVDKTPISSNIMFDKSDGDMKCLTGWTLVSATREDEEALKAAGFFTHSAPASSPLDDTSPEFQVAAEAILAGQDDAARHAAATNIFQPGCRVCWTADNGEERTGTIIDLEWEGDDYTVPRDVARIQVDQIMTAGGVPILRKSMVRLTALSLVEEEASEPEALPFVIGDRVQWITSQEEECSGVIYKLDMEDAGGPVAYIWADQWDDLGNPITTRRTGIRVSCLWHEEPEQSEDDEFDSEFVGKRAAITPDGLASMFGDMQAKRGQ